MPGKASYEIPPSVLYRQVDKELVLLNLESEQYYALNPVGATIIQRLTEEPLDEAMTALLAHYDVEPDVLHQDVQNLVDALVTAGLLVRVEDLD